MFIRVIATVVAPALVAVLVVGALAPAEAGAALQNPPPIRGFNAVTQVDSQGRPVIAYTQLGSIPSEQLVLLARCENPACTSSNIVELSASAVGPVDLALDADDNPVISFRRVPDQTVQLVRCTDPRCTASPRVQDLGAGIGASLALNQRGWPVVAIATTQARLRVVTCDDEACATSASVDPDGVVFPTTGCSLCLGPSLRLDSIGRPLSAYYLQGTGIPDSAVGLTLLRCGAADCSSNNTVQMVEAGSFANASLALGPTDRPVISYVDADAGGLNIAVCADATCSAVRTTELQASRVFGAGWPSEVRVSADGVPVVLSADPQNSTLTLFSCVDRECSSFDVNVATRAFTGLNASDSARASLVLGAEDAPFIAFVGETPTGFALQAISCSDPQCSADDQVIVVDDGFGTSPVPGDANCDGVLNILDAFATAQYVVELRQGVAACPLADASSQINLSNVTVANERVTIQSAFRVSQCVVELTNQLCPAG